MLPASWIRTARIGGFQAVECNGVQSSKLDGGYGVYVRDKIVDGKVLGMDAKLTIHQVLLVHFFLIRRWELERMVDYVIEECPGQKPRRIYTWSTRDPKWVQLPDLKVQGESELIREYPDTEGDQARIFANTYATEKKVERINDL